MILNVIDKNAEDLIFAFLLSYEHENNETETKTLPVKFLQCRFFHIGIMPEISEITELLEPIGADDPVALYYCVDGDIFIRWQQNQNSIPREQITTAILGKYGNIIKKKYDRG